MEDRSKRPKLDPITDMSNQELTTSQKIFKQFFKSDFKTLRKWAIKEVIIPGIQNAILNGLSILFFESDYSSKGGGSERSTISKGSSRIAYNRAYKGNLTTGRREDPRTPDPDDEDYIPDYKNELLCQTEKQAIEILKSMNNIIADFGDATVVQLYSLCGITHPDFQQNNWGWDKEAFKGATFRRAREGWALMIPDAIYLKE